MRKKLTVFISLFMSLVMLFAFAACSKPPQDNGGGNGFDNGGGNGVQTSRLSPFALPANFYFTATADAGEFAFLRFDGEWYYMFILKGSSEINRKYFKDNGDGTYAYYVKYGGGDWEINGEAARAAAFSLCETENEIEKYMVAFLADTAVKSGEKIKTSKDVGGRVIDCDSYTYFGGDDEILSYFVHPQYDLILKYTLDGGDSLTSYEITNLDTSISAWPSLDGSLEFPD